MNVENSIATQKVLIAPLNWGLGHAARCVPIIKQHIEAGNEVIIASDGDALDFLKKEFPQLRCFQLPSYRVIYHLNWFWVRFLYHLLYLKKAIKSEHKATCEIVNTLKPDIIISDNRYGVYHPHSKSLLITHQLSFVFKGWKKIFTTPARKILAGLINKFDECRVPVPDINNNLIPELVKNEFINIDIVPVGYLSRFRYTSGAEKTIDVLVLITGPENYRTEFENEMIEQLNESDCNGILIRSSNKSMIKNLTNHRVTVVDFATTEQLQHWLAHTKTLISRSGYSTVMDALQFDCECLFIPTPNQPEQEYIAQQWANRKYRQLPIGKVKAGEKIL
ncbi:MAG: hypothetical protein IPO27_16505 [Bacteroidetes bacterium]|nr:hypothetical protein [Bacteroidota bacterium]